MQYIIKKKAWQDINWHLLYIIYWNYSLLARLNHKGMISHCITCITLRCFKFHTDVYHVCSPTRHARADAVVSHSFSTRRPVAQLLSNGHRLCHSAAAHRLFQWSTRAANSTQRHTVTPVMLITWICPSIHPLPATQTFQATALD